MSKRKRIILTSFILSLGLVFIQIGTITYRYWAILGLSILSFILSVWTLRENLKNWSWLVVLLPSFLFTVGIGFFYFLLPAQWLTSLPIVILYSFGMYILLLTTNIFLVANMRNIQLLRSAQATSFLLTLIMAFFLFDTVFSFRLDPWFNFIGIFIISFLLFYPGLWSIILGEYFSARLLSLSAILALVLGEFALTVSFWPMSVSTNSLFLTTSLYILLGLTQSYLQEKLFKKTVREYLWVGVAVFLTIFLATHWGD